MSTYSINKILYLTDNDAAFRQRFQAAPEKVLEEFPLSEEERRALTSGDVLALFRMGVHPFLLFNLPRHGLFGVTNENYFPRIRGAAGPPPPAAAQQQKRHS